jgi:hypothetical protein
MGDLIEEETVVEVGGRILTCFLNVCPRAITPGYSYEGILSLWAIDGLELQEAGDEPVGLTRHDDSFRYRVVGTLRGSVLDAGIQFEDESFSEEYAYLDGCLVVVEADRIDLAIE